MAMNELHPSKFLVEKMLCVRGLTGLKLASKLNVSHNTVAEILSARRGISAEMALRLAEFFETTPEYWLEIQMRYDLERARRKLQKKEGTTFGAMERVASFSPDDIFNAEKDSDGDQNCSPVSKMVDWREQMRRSKFIIQEGIEDVFRVYERLGAEPVAFDAIAYDLNLQGGYVSAILVSLELDQWIKRLPGDWIVRVK